MTTLPHLKADETLQLLRQAFDENDPTQHDKVYRECHLDRFKAYRKSVSTTATNAATYDPMHARHTGYLKETSNEEAAAILGNGAKAQEVYGRLSIEERKEFLNKLEEKVAKYKLDIALTFIADTGKPVDLSLEEMKKGEAWNKYIVKEDQITKQLGALDTKGDGTTIVESLPKGVVQVISAYNYPYALAVPGIAGALAGGNAVVVSAADKASNWVFPFMEAVSEATQEFADKAKADHKPWAQDFDRVKDKLIQYSIGRNEHLVKEADLVHFVGSDRTGHYIRDTLRPGKASILEMGGTNVAAVMKSSLEKFTPEAIADTVFAGFGPATGQRCTAPRILFVQEGAEAVTDALKALAEKGPDEKVIGNPYRPGIKMGPLVDRGAHQKMEEAIALAKELAGSDVKAVYGNLRTNSNIVPQARKEGSHWVNPIVIDWGKIDQNDAGKMERVTNLISNEIFGPMLHIVHPVRGLKEAIAKTNQLDTHKLAGAIFTNEESDAREYTRGVRAKSIMVNGAPKDQSPYAEHGDPNLPSMGGDKGLTLYVDRVSRSVTKTENSPGR